MALMAAGPTRYLLTGFGPFGSDVVNPAGLLAEKLGGLVLPVAADAAWALTREAMAARGAEWVIALGVAGGRGHFSVERQAVNATAYPLADDEGQWLDGVIDPARPPGAALVSRFPCARLARAVRARRNDARRPLPARVSRDAGRYVCNHFYFHLLRELDGRALFLHVPRLPEIAAGGPAWPLADTERALRAVLRALEKAGMVPA